MPSESFLHVCVCCRRCRLRRGFRLPYEQRIPLARCAMAKRCLEVMVRKQTNLSVAADVDTAEEMLAMAEKVRGGREEGEEEGEGGWRKG